MHVGKKAVRLGRVQPWLLCVYCCGVRPTQDAEWRTLIPLEDGKTWEDGATTRQGGWYPPCRCHSFGHFGMAACAACVSACRSLPLRKDPHVPVDLDGFIGRFALPREQLASCFHVAWRAPSAW